MFLYICNNAIVITMYVYYVCAISLVSLSHVLVYSCARVIVQIVLVSVVRLYYEHGIANRTKIVLCVRYIHTMIGTADTVCNLMYEIHLYYHLYHR